MSLSTILTRQIIARLYSIREDSGLFKHLRHFERSQWLSTEDIMRIQLNKLKRLLIYSYENVPFYKKRFMDSSFYPRSMKDLDGLRRVPPLTKIEIMDNYELMVSEKYLRKDLVKSCTGGSTGTQLHFLLTKESIDRKNACAWRHNRWANWDLGVPVAAVWGNPKPIISLKERMRRTLLNRTFFLDTMDMTPNSMNAFVEKINRQREYVLYGHAHSIYLLADHIAHEDCSVKKPNGIVTTSMMLMSNERDIIESVFHQKVCNRYGCEEVSLVGSECEVHEGMHLNMDHVFVEFLKEDGAYALPGEEGKIIVTDLTNYGMPFIRYEVGDVGVPSNRICPCGRGLSLMERVVGRTADFLIKKDGSRVAGISLIERVLTNNPGIQQMQIIQNDPDSLFIKIVKGEQYIELITLDILRKEISKIFPNMGMHIELVNKISQERSGKYRFSICNI